MSARTAFGTMKNRQLQAKSEALETAWDDDEVLLSALAYADVKADPNLLGTYAIAFFNWTGFTSKRLSTSCGLCQDSNKRRTL